MIVFKRRVKQVGGTEEVRGRMVFRGKISEETRAYIKFTKDLQVKEVMKESGVSRVQIFKIRKEKWLVIQEKECHRVLLYS